MQGGTLVQVILPLILATIMLGMGLSLTVDDFKRVFRYPKGVMAGVTCQMVLVPLAAFAIAYALDAPPLLAIGLIVLAACPGGTMSNLICYLAGGNTALSVTLTAFSSVLTIITIPLLIGLGYWVFLGESQTVESQAAQTMKTLFGIVIVPIILGMVIHRLKPELARTLVPWVNKLGTVFLLILIVMVLIKNREIITDAFADTGLMTLLLNLSTMAMGFLVARFIGLNMQQQLTLSIETGFQNTGLAIVIAESILRDSTVALTPSIYSLVMFTTTGLLIGFVHSPAGKTIRQSAEFSLPERLRTDPAD